MSGGSAMGQREANGTFLDSTGSPALTKIYDYIQIRVPVLDFKFAEPFNVKILTTMQLP